MKIPFDIKFRPQIESGEYKVEIGEDDPWPARIVCWDLNGNDLIVIISNPGGREEGLIYTSDGRHNAYVPRVDSNLFIVTPEPELTEFEKGILDVTKKYLLIPPDSDGVRDRDDQLKWLHETANRLFSIAKKELSRIALRILKGTSKVGRTP